MEQNSKIKILSMNWYKRFLGKKVTLNGCKDTYYQGVLIACMNGRLFLKDAFVCQEGKKAKFPVISVETRFLRCLYLKEGDETISLNLRAIDAG